MRIARGVEEETEGILALLETIGREKSVFFSAGKKLQRPSPSFQTSSSRPRLWPFNRDENRGGKPPPPPLFAISLLLLSPRSLLFFLQRIPLNTFFLPPSFFFPLYLSDEEERKTGIPLVVSNLENSLFPLFSPSSFYLENPLKNIWFVGLLSLDQRGGCNFITVTFFRHRHRGEGQRKERERVFPGSFLVEKRGTTGQCQRRREERGGREGNVFNDTFIKGRREGDTGQQSETSQRDKEFSCGCK